MLLRCAKNDTWHSGSGDVNDLHVLQFQLSPLPPHYPRRARSAIGVDTVLTLDVCLYVCMYVSALERKRLIGMT